MALDCEVSQCCLVRFLEQGYLRELACKADKAFLLLIICPTHTHTEVLVLPLQRNRIPVLSPG